MSIRANGTYRAVPAPRRPVAQTRLLIGAGAVVAVLGLLNVILINMEMTRLEQAGPPRLAITGSGVERFVPSLLANLQRAQQSPSTVTAVLAGDPRRSPEYIDHKRALERWVAVIGLGLAALFLGLESTIPEGSAAARSPIGSDLARLLILLSLAMAGLSFFEGG
jgi:hypothetical protein